MDDDQVFTIAIVGIAIAWSLTPMLNAAAPTLGDVFGGRYAWSSTEHPPSHFGDVTVMLCGYAVVRGQYAYGRWFRYTDDAGIGVERCVPMAWRELEEGR